MTQDEMVGRHHQRNGHEFEQAPGEPGVLLSLGSQRARHNLAAEQQTPAPYSDPFSFLENFVYYLALHTA